MSAFAVVLIATDQQKQVAERTLKAKGPYTAVVTYCYLLNRGSKQVCNAWRLFVGPMLPAHRSLKLMLTQSSHPHTLVHENAYL